MKRILPIVLVGILALSGLGAGAVFEKENDEINDKAKSILFSTTTYDDEYAMVIIAPNKFSSNIQPLIDHKNSHDIQTFLKTTEEIYNECEGRDKAEQIKYFIKDAIETNNVDYVLLIGGRNYQFLNWHVPVRYVHLDDGFLYPTYISDLYFADIYKNGDEFDDWDSDGDGIFAEWGEDDLDLVPDVCIGRLPCRNRFEVKIVVDKIIYYENNAYGASWFNKAIFVGGDSFTGVGDPFPYEGEETCDVAASYLDGFEKIKLYASLGTSTEEELIDSLTEGCGFVMTRCKGGSDRVRLPLLDGSELIILNNRNVPKFRNKNMYPILVLGQCWNAKFDVSLMNIFGYLRNESYIYESDCIPECIGWRMVRKINGGSIATLSNTNTCYGAFGDSDQNGIPDDAELFGGFLAVEVFRLYGEEEMETLGEIHKTTIENYITTYPAVYSNNIHCKSIQEWILIGDPSLMIGGYL